MGRDENYLYGFSSTVRPATTMPQEYLRKACGADDALTQNASYHLADCYLRAWGQAAGDAVVRHGFECRIRFRDCRRRAVQLWKIAIRTGGGRFNEAIQVLNRYVAQYPSSPRVRTAKELLAAYYNSHNYDEAYEIIASYPDPDGDLLAASRRSPISAA